MMTESRATEARVRRLAAELGVEVRKYRDRVTGPGGRIAIRENPRKRWSYSEPDWAAAEQLLIAISQDRERDRDRNARLASLRAQVAELRAELTELEADLEAAEQAADPSRKAGDR